MGGEGALIQEGGGGSTDNGLGSGQLFGIGHLFKEIRYSILGFWQKLSD